MILRSFIFATKHYNMSLVRYGPDGSLDASFGAGGVKMFNFPISNHANALALQSDGKLLAAGYVRSRTIDFPVARFDLGAIGGSP